MATSTEMKKASGDDGQVDAIIDRRRRDRMHVIDNMPVELRKCVHEYGLCVVKAFLDVGLTKPKQIRHLTETILNELSAVRGSSSSQGTQPDLARRD